MLEVHERFYSESHVIPLSVKVGGPSLAVKEFILHHHN